jgi:hypothetical protein
MKGKKTAFHLAVTLMLTASLALPAMAFDSTIVRDLNRNETSAELEKHAYDILRKEASLRPKSFEEGTQIAAETVAYLLMIQIKQNSLIMEQNRQLLEELKKKP